MKFEELKLTAGFPIQLQGTGVETDRFSCRLVGSIADKTIIVTYPRARRAAARLRTGQKLTVRIMVGNGICMFAAAVEQIVTNPHPIVHLSYPRTVGFKEIRGATRVETSLPVTIENLNGFEEARADGLVNDISISGAKLALREEAAEVGDKVEISAEIMIGPISKELRVSAVVRSRIERSTKEHNKNFPAVYGVEFTENDDDKLIVLYAYVYRELSFNQLPSAER